MLRSHWSDRFRFIVPRVAALLCLALLAVGAPAMANGAEVPWTQLPTSPRPLAPVDIGFTEIGQIGGIAHAVVPVDHYLLTSAGPRLFLFDVLVEDQPLLLLQSPPLPGDVLALAAADPYAYAAAGEAGFFILDLSNPTRPVPRGFLATPGIAQDVTVDGNVAYVAAGSAGLRLIDVSDASHPVEVGSWEEAGLEIPYVAVDPPYAYVTDGDEGLRVLDVSNPAAPIEVAALELPGTPQGIAIASGHAYVAAGRFGLHVVDISNPLQPFLAGSSGTNAESMDVVAIGRYAYVADINSYDEVGERLYPGGLRTVDVSSPNEPDQVSRLSGDVSTLAAQDDRVYLVSHHLPGGYGSTNAYEVVSLADPAHPQRAGVFGIPNAMDETMVASGTSLYLHDQGLSRIDLSDPSRPRVVWNLQLPGDDYPYPAQLYALDVSGGYAYVGAGDVGLHVVDVRDPKRPRWLTTLKVDAQTVAVQGSLAAVGGLRDMNLVDVSDPSRPRVIRTIDSDPPNDIQLLGDRLYTVTNDPDELLIYDVSDPTHPLLLGSLDLGDWPFLLEVGGTYAYLGLAFGHGLLVIDVSDPASPTEVSRLELGSINDMTRADDHLLVTLPSIPGGGLRSIDVSDPAQPRVDGEYILSDTFAEEVAVLPGGIVVLGTTTGGDAPDGGLRVLQGAFIP